MFKKAYQALRQKYYLVLSTIITILGIIIFIWFCIRGLIFEKFIDINGVISLEKSSQFGDFIGGCTGALFALVGVFLLFETLKLQRTELSESRHVFEKQQFDNTFFNLLTLYQSIVNELIYNQEKGKRFFDCHRNDIYENFTGGRKDAKDKYIQFYTANDTKVAHYFRVLYQIFCIIDDSNLDEKDKVRYAKFTRAQLSESEEFFLYYNANTPYGAKFRKFINEYNLIKHLPPLDKLEFKRYSIRLNEAQRHSISVALFELKKAIKLNLQERKTWHKTFLQGALSLQVLNPMDNQKQINIILTKNDTVAIPARIQQGMGFELFDNTDIINLFTDYLTDIFLLSNYYLLNDRGLFISHIESIEGNKIKIIFSVSHRNNKRIELL